MSASQEAAQATVTDQSRRLSNEVFGRQHQLEVATAAAAMDGGFVIEDLVIKARERANEAGLEPPKESSVRTNLARLVSAGAVDVLRGRPGVAGYYSVAGASTFWPFVLDLHERI